MRETLLKQYIMKLSKTFALNTQSHSFRDVWGAGRQGAEAELDKSHLLLEAL